MGVALPACKSQLAGLVKKFKLPLGNLLAILVDSHPDDLLSAFLCFFITSPE